MLAVALIFSTQDSFAVTQKTERMAPRKAGRVGSRFTPSHIKRMMQQDEEVGKVANAVPAMLGRALELFSTNLLPQAGQVTEMKGAKTMTPEHLATVINDDPRLDFLRHLIKNVTASTHSKKSPTSTKRVHSTSNGDIRSKEMKTKVKKVNTGVLESGEKLLKAKKVPTMEPTYKIEFDTQVSISDYNLQQQGIQSNQSNSKSLHGPTLSQRVSSLAVQTPSTVLEVDEDYDC